MKTIGITGGIGSGKSTVSEYLASRGYEVIDADKIAFSITEGDSSALLELVSAFGNQVLGDDGKLDRKKLASIAFADENSQQLLNKIMHEKIIGIILQEKEKIFSHGGRIVFIDAALLIESGLDKECDIIWVICVPDEIKVERATVRGNQTKDDIKKRIALQMTDEERLASSKKTQGVSNIGGKEELYKRVDVLIKDYV